MKQVRAWMAENGFTQKDIAKWFKKSQPAVSDILNGHTVLNPGDAKILISKSKGALSWEKIYGEVKS